MFCRYGPAAWSSLAASLALHGAVVGGLALSSHAGAPDLFGGDGAPGAAGSGGAILVSLSSSWSWLRDWISVRM